MKLEIRNSFYSYNYTKHDNILLYLTFVPLFLFSAFRNGLGTDYLSYAYLYSHPETIRTEFLFKYLFIDIPRFFSTNELTFFIVSSFVVNILILKTIFKYSPIVFMSILLFLFEPYFISYNAVRQYIGIAIFIYFGVQLVQKQHWLGYLILILIVAQIHFSFYVMLLSPLLLFRRYSTQSYLIFWCISFLIFIGQMVNLLNFKYLLSSLQYLDFMTVRFQDVIEAADTFYEAFSTNYFHLLKNLICVVLVMRLTNVRSIRLRFWMSLYLFGIIVSNILISFSSFANRICFISDIALLILLPIYVKSFHSRRTQMIISVVIIIFFAASFYYKFVMQGHSDIFKKGEWIIEH